MEVKNEITKATRGGTQGAILTPETVNSTRSSSYPPLNARSS